MVDDLDRLFVASQRALRRVLGESRERPEVAIVEGRRPLVPEGTEIALVRGTRDARFERKLVERSGLTKRFEGRAQVRSGGATEAFSVYDAWEPESVVAAPPTFDVLAIIPCFNEADIIEATVRALWAKGARVHVIDNASTDATPAILARLQEESDRIVVERFPKDGPAPHYELAVILGEVERVAAASGADWAVLNDADEWLSCPWPEESLRQGLFVAQQFGFNSINFACCDFAPTSDAWAQGQDPESVFDGFRFSDKRGAFFLQRAWMPAAGDIAVAAQHGHDISFAGRRTFPYRFVLDHYPVRSQPHGIRKVLRERKERYSPEERAKGLHIHYDHYDDATNFIVDPAGLHARASRAQEWKLQLLSGAGLEGNPQAAESLAWVEDRDSPPG